VLSKDSNITSVVSHIRHPAAWISWMRGECTTSAAPSSANSVLIRNDNQQDEAMHIPSHGGETGKLKTGRYPVTTLPMCIQAHP
jgi:hypothetical protein